MKKVGVGLLQLGLTVAVTWFIFDRVGVDLAVLGRLNAGEWRPRPALFLASCSVLVIGYVWSASLWGRLVRDLGGPRLPVWTSVRVFMVANLGRYVPGKVWQIAGLAYLAKREGVQASVATGAAILGQGISLLGATLIGIGALFGPSQAEAEAEAEVVVRRGSNCLCRSDCSGSGDDEGVAFGNEKSLNQAKHCKRGTKPSR